MSDLNKRMLISYVVLRRWVGILGGLLPLWLLGQGYFLCHCIQPSISHYYDLRTRDVFVGVLFVIGAFLFTYKGYERRDSVAAKLGGTFAILVAVFPHTGPAWQRYLHFGSAVALFVVLFIFAFCFFTRSEDSPTRAKRIRNLVYRLCGLFILLCILLIVLIEWLRPETVVTALKPIFLLETIAIEAFAVSWLVKGETLWKDSAPGSGPAAPAYTASSGD